MHLAGQMIGRSLVELMEGVEDIPAPVMHEGLEWSWETFPEYLDALDRGQRDTDICALLPHAALRVYVMGDRAIRHEAATPEDMEQMRKLAAEASHAGAPVSLHHGQLAIKAKRVIILPLYVLMSWN